MSTSEYYFSEPLASAKARLATVFTENEAHEFRSLVAAESYEELKQACISIRISEDPDGDGHTLTQPDHGILFRYLTALLGHSFDDRKSGYLLTDQIRAEQLLDLQRIANQLSSFPDTFYRIDNEPFKKDLSILLKTLIPFGAEYGAVGSGISRRLAFTKDIGQFLTVCKLSTTIHPNQRNSFLSLHMHTLNTSRLTELACVEMYKKIAEFLNANPAVPGIISCSWFVDPEITTISPHLAHLRCIPQSNGAAILFVAYESSKSGALSKSRKRRMLYEEGKYRPATWMRVWLRADILKWNAQHEMPTKRNTS